MNNLIHTQFNHFLNKEMIHCILYIDVGSKIYKYLYNKIKYYFLKIFEFIKINETGICNISTTCYTSTKIRFYKIHLITAFHTIII